MKIDFVKKNVRSKLLIKNGILTSDITDEKTLLVSNFYQKNPFPNYDGYENKLSLSSSLNNNYFLKDLKETVGFGKSFLEVGSGTSQLSLAMAIGTDNQVVALDPTIQSLFLGKDFAEKNDIKNVIFFNSDIFDNLISEKYFDFVWCSGVLHHTKDSQKGFEIISSWVKPGGLIIIGLYNKYGRLRTNFRQVLYKFFSKFKFGKKLMYLLDPHLRKIYSEEKKRAWLRDQYEHPIERNHTIDEVIEWFDRNDISFLGSIPNLDFDGEKKISKMNGNRQNWFIRFFAQFLMVFSNLGSEGGLFIVIGKRNNNSK